ncbi:MAG: hypothetical protein M1445_10220 [Bacteroidetes bacterium]|nr:hypothetical protein [Bacteroidota bacterium]MCL6103338.1 hypothetical protein [Bacteroidota bacterium]
MQNRNPKESNHLLPVTAVELFCSSCGHAAILSKELYLLDFPANLLTISGNLVQ